MNFSPSFFRKFEDLSRLMSEEDNWRTYKIELKEIASSKNHCVPFLGQFLTQIVQQETVNDLKSHRRKSRGRRPQSIELGNHETLSAPASPVNSFHEDPIEPVASPNIMKPPANEHKTNSPSDILNHIETSVDEKDEPVNLKWTSGSGVVERRDKLSPLPIGKFKNPLQNNLYRHSVDLLDDGANSSDSLGSSPPRDIQLDDSFLTSPISPLDISNIEVSIVEDRREDVVRESTPVELNEPILEEPILEEFSFDGSDTEVSIIEGGGKKTSSFGLKKKRWSSLKRKISSPVEDSSNTSCSDTGPQKRENKLHIYDIDNMDVHMILQQMQFASLSYMNSFEYRLEVQNFIEGLHYNTEEENYHNSLEVEPNDQPLY